MYTVCLRGKRGTVVVVGRNLKSPRGEEWYRLDKKLK